jgi:hypothetical protein
VTKDKVPVRSMIEIQLDLLFSYIGSSVVIKLPKFNVLIKWDKKVSAQNVNSASKLYNKWVQLNVEIHAPAALKGNTVGICGTWDGDASNDWQDIDFVNHNLPNFVASWIDNKIESKNRCYITYFSLNGVYGYSVSNLQQNGQHHKSVR